MSNLRVLDLRLTQEETHCDARRVDGQDDRHIGLVVEWTQGRRLDQGLLQLLLRLYLLLSEEKLDPLLRQMRQRVSDLRKVSYEDTRHSYGTQECAHVGKRRAGPPLHYFCDTRHLRKPALWSALMPDDRYFFQYDYHLRS